MRKQLGGFRRFILLAAALMLLMGQSASADRWEQSGGRWWYSRSDGSYIQNAWLQDGGWYHFDQDGWMQTGWQQIGGVWYYFETDGRMATGWKQLGGARYYFEGSGAMAVGWRRLGGIWYYFEGSGAMAAGWRQLGGVWYYFEADGAMVTGFKTLAGVTYFFTDDGAMATGWKQLGGVWYYFEGSGAMAKGWLQSSDGSWYYFKASGVMAQNESLTIDGKDYTFLSDGRMAESAGTSSLSPDLPATRDNLLAFLDDLDPDGAYILRHSNEATVNSWLGGASTIGETLHYGGFSHLDTAVHEQCHDFCGTPGGVRYNPILGRGQRKSEWIYIGGGNHITVNLTNTFASSEMVSTIPASLRTFRFDTYVNGDLVMASNQFGPYGLLDEFTAYCWGMHNQVAVRDYMRENRIRELYDNNYVAYAEFRYYILHYMLYAREHYPEVYQEILNNTSFRRAFTTIDGIFRGLIEQARSKHMIGSYHEKNYNALMAEMQKAEYTEMASLLRP